MLMLDDKEFVMNPDRLALVPLPISESSGVSQNFRGGYQEPSGKVVIDLSSDDEENTTPPLNTPSRKIMNGGQRDNVKSGRHNSSQVKFELKFPCPTPGTEI